jgi:hypothetical protein
VGKAVCGALQLEDRDFNLKKYATIFAKYF